MKIAAGIAALFLTVFVLMALAQDRLLFPRWAVARGPALPATAERLTLSLASGDKLLGVHLPAERRSPPGAALLLGFAGNAWNADALAIYLQSMFPDRDVALSITAATHQARGSPVPVPSWRTPWQSTTTSLRAWDLIASWPWG